MRKQISTFSEVRTMKCRMKTSYIHRCNSHPDLRVCRKFDPIMEQKQEGLADNDAESSVEGAWL